MTKRVLRLFPICVLLCLTSCTGRSDHWLSLLEQAEEMNRNDVPFTSDSLGLALVGHYDHWWHSPHLRLRAYYMLGSAYRDMGEAPAAIHYYNIATEQVDTAHADSATYATLFRVYGQMAMIYRGQNLPREQLDALSAFSHYAWLAKDTLSCIRGIEFMITPYYELNDTIKSLQYTEKAKSLFLKYGYIQNAAGIYPTAIYISLLNGNTARAKQYMDIFENESGLFDEHGNIEAGREHYYHSKGLYYTQVGLLDSAEYFYRKLQSFNYSLEACEGLLNIYNIKGITDSIVKYSALYKTMQEQWVATRQSDAILLSSAMYKYERNQNLAMLNAQRAKRFKYISLLLFIFAIWIYGYYRRRIREREAQMRNLDRAYTLARKEHGQLVEEYEILKREHEKTKSSKDIMALIEQKQEKIAQLDETIRNYQEKLGAMTYSQRKKLLMGNDIVDYFIRKKTLTPAWKAPTIDKWMALSDVYSQYMPLVAAAMDRAELSRQELLTTILTHLDFSPSDIAILLETGKSRISAVKKSACRKLFEEDGVILKQRLVDMESGGFINNFSTP